MAIALARATTDTATTAATTTAYKVSDTDTYTAQV